MLVFGFLAWMSGPRSTRAWAWPALRPGQARVVRGPITCAHDTDRQPNYPIFIIQMLWAAKASLVQSEVSTVIVYYQQISTSGKIYDDTPVTTRSSKLSIKAKTKKEKFHFIHVS